MSAWDGVNLDVIREAANDPQRSLLLTLGTNLFGGQQMVYVETIDPINPRRKPVRVVPGPLLAPDGEGWPSTLRMLADIIEGTVECAQIEATPVRCGGGCHERNDSDCPACDSGDGERMCQGCLFYAAQDAETATGR